jgi:hypothetical protein
MHTLDARLHNRVCQPQEMDAHASLLRPRNPAMDLQHVEWFLEVFAAGTL